MQRCQFEETLNSLKYANRAKNIRTQEVHAQVERPQTASELLSEVRDLRSEIMQAQPKTAPARTRGGGRGSNPNPNPNPNPT